MLSARMNKGSSLPYSLNEQEAQALFRSHFPFVPLPYQLEAKLTSPHDTLSDDGDYVAAIARHVLYHLSALNLHRYQLNFAQSADRILRKIVQSLSVLTSISAIHTPVSLTP